MSVNNFDVELDEHRRRSIERFACAETLDLKAFQSLHDYLCRKSEELRAEYVVSKQILACLSEASGYIRSRAEYLPEVREHLSIAEDFELLLDLIIAGEAWSDRTHGSPRII